MGIENDSHFSITISKTFTGQKIFNLTYPWMM
ncbi:hypothetical protein J2795_002974 [Chryseobacterium bernardetii]|jgi:hypothetical protein|uniref:Uncharacterized protein n=2 Tax=Chryseobacterium TaxID=59732 RepID=A0ACC6IXC7_9FLAO|nr:hypothetical protein [Chryseobacterium vietnamense]MDR6442249.1 hypothetical protein [Chryseobacterium bernardetii]MDR6458747.1 hypothetical protein [Chryseobacterium vietnamense]